MDEKKRMVQGYEVVHAIQLGGGEVILAENKDAEARYLVCDCKWDNPLGVMEYLNGVASGDYVEIAREFTNRLSARLDAIEAERAERGLPPRTLTAADCEQNGMDRDLEGRVVVIKPEKLSPEYRSIDHQLALCKGGFGARPDARGTAVFCVNLYTGKSSQWRRDDIAGTISEDRLPDWARANLAALREPSGKGVPAAEPLDKEKFWRIIDAARENAGHWKGMYEPLLDELSKLTDTDIIRWKQIFDEYQALSYKDKLWAAAATMMDGCSDDSFDYFRGWLTSQGKDVYLTALADPDSLAGFDAVKSFASELRGNKFAPANGYQEEARFEEMLYAAGAAYGMRPWNGDIYDILDEIPLSDQEKAGIAAEITYAADIDAKWGGLGKPWPETADTLKKLCPKLYKLFNDDGQPELAPDERKPDDKESVLEKIKRDRQNKRSGKQEPKQSKTKKSKKDGPEL